jgi:TIGR03009 family protein
MSRLRGILITASLGPFLASLALAFARGPEDGGTPVRQPQQGQAPGQAAMDMARLLVNWQGQSAKLKTLEVDIERIDKNLAWGDEEHFLGHAAFRSPREAYLFFSKVTLQQQPDPKDKKKKVLVPVKKDDKIQSKPFEKMVCTGEELWQYRYEVKQIFVFPLNEEESKLVLEEGPLRFLFNLKAEEVRRRYEMVLYRADQTGYGVKITPRLQEDKDNFSQAWVHLDKDFLLPTHIHLLARDGKSTQDFHLSNIRANQPMDARLFALSLPGKLWKVQHNPGGTTPAPPAGRVIRRTPQNQPAQRPPDINVDQPR